ncbi:MAG: hypothetical protein KDK39_01280 [Leptospiraceae bacterium]|nr:hypothetical protein [Leptospiraceae bacterium]
MEFYIPDTEFEHADFKGVSSPKDPQVADAGSQGTPVVNRPKEQPHTNATPRQRPDQRAGSPAAADSALPGTSREPVARGYKIRDRFGNPLPAGGSAQNQPPTPGARPSAKNELPAARSPGLRSRQSIPAANAVQRPPRSPREARKQALQKEHSPDNWQPARMSRAKVRQMNRQSAPQTSQSAEPDSSQTNSLGLLQQTVLADLAGSRQIINRWFWEKPGSGDPLLSFAPPRDRIHCLLKALGRDVLPLLFRVMSPAEQNEMVAILKEAPGYPSSWLPAIQTAFMRALEEQKQWQ